MKRFFLILIILTGMAVAFLRYEPVKELSHISSKEVVLEGSAISLPAETKSGMVRQSLKIQSAFDVMTGKEITELRKQEVVILSDRESIPWTECKMRVKFLNDSTRLNPGKPVSKEIYARLLELNKTENKKNSLGTKIRMLRYRLNKYIQGNFEKDSSAFISAITIGQRALMDEDLSNAFNKTGLAHILSISGTHFGLFSIFLFGIFRILINVLPYRVLQRITIYLTPSQAAALLCLPFMFAYLGLSGGNIPAVRSFIMVGLFLLGLLIGRKDSWLNSLFFAAFVLSVWDPKVILDISFQLSFLAVLFIGFSIKNKDEKKQDKKTVAETPVTSGIKKIPIYLKNVLLLSVSASIGTAPLVAYYFHYFSIISPISNLFITPIIGFVLIPLAIFSSFLFLITGHYVFTTVVSTVSGISIYLVKFMSAIPYADIKVPAFPLILIFLFYAGFLFYFLSGRKKYTLLIPFVPIFVYILLSTLEKKELTVTYLDVGQGDSAVIELPDGKTMVIDTGRTGKETASFLKYRGKKTIDAIILSHVHSDHTGGLYYLIKSFKVKELWDNGRLIYPGDFINHTKVKHRMLNRGDMVEEKGYSISTFHPYPEFYTMYGDESIEADNESLILKIKGNNKSFVFTGDVEEEAEEDVSHLSVWLKGDVIKVPHHGSKKSAYEPFFNAVSPDIAIISVGRDNPFGHPHQEMLDVLDGKKIFRTDLDGAIKIKESENGLETKTYKDFQFQQVKSLREEIRNLKRLFETW
ncbi:MAG: DNA internalization-related competence protein ComEC/Rec2 [Nitrospirae bacterium]|nr:DNA internalization-related competence protein ComEC/Rec2 [Nitrospirota bacterium]